MKEQLRLNNKEALTLWQYICGLLVTPQYSFESRSTIFIDSRKLRKYKIIDGRSLISQKQTNKIDLTINNEGKASMSLFSLTLFCCIILFVVLYCIVMCCIVLLDVIVLYCFDVSNYIVINSGLLYCIVLYCIVCCCIVVYC